MIRRLALTAGFAVLSAVAFAPKAHGQVAPAVTEPVTFEGTVGSVCTLTDPNPGVLVQAGDALVSRPIDGGESGSITVNCTGSNEVSVAAPTPVQVPPAFATPLSLKAELMENGNPFADSDTGATNSVAPGIDAVLGVDMEIISGSGFPAGVYEYDVEVTAAPN
ncbi:MAG: hypothetical protein WBA07_19920 [Rivularia sp. (in: cyanobacteria)]